MTSGDGVGVGGGSQQRTLLLLMQSLLVSVVDYGFSLLSLLPRYHSWNEFRTRERVQSKAMGAVLALQQG